MLFGVDCLHQHIFAFANGKQYPAARLVLDEINTLKCGIRKLLFNQIFDLYAARAAERGYPHVCSEAKHEPKRQRQENPEPVKSIKQSRWIFLFTPLAEVVGDETGADKTEPDAECKDCPGVACSCFSFRCGAN